MPQKLKQAYKKQHSKDYQIDRRAKSNRYIQTSCACLPSENLRAVQSVVYVDYLI